MKRKLSDDELIAKERRKADRVFAFRRKLDFVYSYLRSCAVCSTSLPPIDLLCSVCWRKFDSVVNRCEKLKQGGYPFPVYSLLTWTPQTEQFVKPFIYGFKGGRTVRAAEKLANLFLAERFLSLPPSEKTDSADLFLSQAPGSDIDHASLWARTLSEQIQSPSWPVYRDVSPQKVRQKEKSQTERAERRFEIREQFAGCLPLKSDEFSVGIDGVGQAKRPKRILFADDVITSGATAMAAYMALGDPDQFEVWSLVARPRLAGKSRLC